MKNLIKVILLVVLIAVLNSCGNSEKEDKPQIKLGEPAKKEAPKTTQAKSSMHAGPL